MTYPPQSQRELSPWISLCPHCLPRWFCNRSEPADAQIKGALYDIDKYEKQFAGQNPVNAVTVNRTLKLLRLTRQRLDSSPNQGDASWLDADSRLKALVARLESATSSSTSPASSTPVASEARTAAHVQMRFRR